MVSDLPVPPGSSSGDAPMNEYIHRSAAPAFSDEWIVPVLKAEMEGLPANSVVADLGCGNGAVLAQFLDSGFDLHGLEMSQSGLAQGRKACPDIQFSYADLTSDLSSHPLCRKM